MSQLLRDKLTYALELVDGSKDNPECNSQMLWNEQHSYLRFLLVDCIKLVDLKQDIRDMANEQLYDNWIHVKDKLPELGQRIKYKTSDITHGIGYVTRLNTIKSLFSYTVYSDFEEFDRVNHRLTHWQPLPEKERFTARPGKKCVTLSYNGYEYCCPSPTDSWGCDVDVVGLVDWLNGVLSARNK